MTFTYPLVQILLYLSLFFSPPDATRITVTGPDLTLEIKRDSGGWTIIRDGQPARISASDGVFTSIGGDTKETLALTEYIAAAIGHDWTTAPKTTLHPSTTLEKTTDGYTLRIDEGTPAARAYLIAYETPAPAATATISVNVIGSVNAPGPYVLSADATLLDAIKTAKGFTRLAHRSRVQIVRGAAGEKPDSITVNADKIMQESLPQAALRDGDTIFIPERVF